MEFEDMSNNKLKKFKQEDRLSDLHDDLLLDILSFLPTKDAVATCMLSRRWSHVFKLLQRLEFVDDDHYSYSTPTNNIKAFRKFKGLVDGVLQKLSDSEYITSFKLKFGKYDNDFENMKAFRKFKGLVDGDELKGINIDSWLNYPLNHGGIKEVDISFYLKGFPRNKVPLGYFNCPTLEVLKLDGNFKIEVPLDLELPVLKELYLRWDTIENESIDLDLDLEWAQNRPCIDRLVSSCPLLQHLSLIGKLSDCDNSNCIRAKNLRSLDICFYNYDEAPKTKFVLDVPNLETLSYRDHEACHYFVGEMNALIEAHLGIMEVDPFIYSEQYCSDVPTFLCSLSNVRSLRILELGCLEEILKFDESVVLPVFGKLKYLEIGCVERSRTVSNKTLLKLLNSAPILETLSFPGIFLYDLKIYKEEYFFWMGMLEAKLWKITQTIPTCLSVSLKRIMMKKYQRTEWELQVVTYFLKSSLLLEELIIVCDTPVTMEDKIKLQTTLQNLPLLSPNCSIIVD